MAYVKLPKLVQDSPIGFQTVNQLADNMAAMKTLMEAEHGTFEPSIFPPLNPNRTGRADLFATVAFDFNQLGLHNLAEVPRSVVSASVYVPGASDDATLRLSLTGPAIGFINRWSTGVYTFAINGLTNYWAIATPSGSGANARLALCRPNYAGQNSFNSLVVNTYVLNVTTVLTDYNFWLAVYGDVQ